MPNFFCYMRIATDLKSDIHTYTSQEKALERYEEKNKIKYTEKYMENNTGKNFLERKEWKRMEDKLYKGDQVIMKDISRFSADSSSGYRKYIELMRRDIELVFLDNEVISTPYIKAMLTQAKSECRITDTVEKAIIQSLFSMELDRTLEKRAARAQRSKDGISASEKKCGRPVGTICKMNKPGLEDRLREYLTNRRIKQIDIMKEFALSRNTVKKYAELVKQGKVEHGKIKLS